MGVPEEAVGAPVEAVDVESPPETAPPPQPAAVSFRQVLRTADAWDVLLMVTGTICGAACGAVQPWCARLGRVACGLRVPLLLLRAQRSAGPRDRARPRSSAAAARRRPLRTTLPCCVARGGGAPPQRAGGALALF